MDTFFLEYRKKLGDGLQAVGMSYVKTLEATGKVHAFDPSIYVEHWTGKGCQFLLSRGCSLYPGNTKDWRDEFIVEIGDNLELALKLLMLVMYFHLTRRPISIAEALAIGDIPENNKGFSHVFVSVPFFFPGDINVMRIGKVNFSLSWLMPIFYEEALYIEKHGADMFENKLAQSDYDFFDERIDLSYLQSN
jgi:hypothetical protein